MWKLIITLLFLSQLSPPTRVVIRGDTVVTTSAELQQALIRGGDIVLQTGRTFTGNFMLRKAGTRLYTNVLLVGRSDPKDTRLAKLVSGNGASVLTILASDVVVQKVAFPDSISSDTVQVGQLDGQTQLSQQPHNVKLDQVVITGAIAGGAKRGVALHCSACGVTNSYIADIKRTGQDTQAIWILNGSGPFEVRNNYLEAAGENVMVGGDNPRIPDLVPEDITIVDNFVTKSMAWRTQSWTVKNLLELKAGRHVVIKNNIFENLWQGGQPGWSIVFTPQGLPSVQVSDVRFEDNIVRNVSSGFNILGYAQIGTSLQTCDIVIVNNWFVLSKALYGGQGWFMQLGLQPCRVSATFNTIEQDGNQFIAGTGAPVLGFEFHSNIVSRAGTYGIFLQDAAKVNQPYGKNWRQFFPDGMIEDNAILAAPAALKTNVPNNFYSATGPVVGGRGQGDLALYGRK